MDSDVVEVKAPFTPLRVRAPRQNVPRMRLTVESEALLHVSEVRALPLRKRRGVSARVRFPRAHYDHSVGSMRKFRLKPPATVGLEKKVIATLVVMPNMQSGAIEFLNKYLSQFSSNAFGILAYVDETTLEFLDKVPGRLGIRLLVSAISGGPARFAEKSGEERRTRELEIAQITFVKDDTERPLFHERWITDGKVLIDIGTDLKGSSFAAKQHTISVFDARAYRDRIDNFEWYWKNDELALSRHFGVGVRKRYI
jgi:hypothetical protein